MFTAEETKREELPTEKERGEPPRGRRALEKSKNSCYPSKVAKDWRNIPLHPNPISGTDTKGTPRAREAQRPPRSIVISAT